MDKVEGSYKCDCGGLQWNGESWVGGHMVGCPDYSIDTEPKLVCSWCDKSLKEIGAKNKTKHTEEHIKNGDEYRYEDGYCAEDGN